MGISTQRLLIMIVIVNMVLSMAFAISGSPRNIDYGVFTETVNLGDNVANSLEGEQSSVTPQNLQEEGSFGGVLSMGWNVMKIFARGLVALPFTAGMFTSDPIVKLGGYVFLILWALMYILIIIETYMFFKNKKAN